ncbi:TonB-dependent receptor [Oxalobacteraceae bacterium A2-2]
MTQAVAMALASLVAGGAHAQQAAVQTAHNADAREAAQEEVAKVLVVGARASQQSAITKKKNADTAQDSIIAEDVGAFPDRNVADAISRVAGVAVDRGVFGEGISVSIRGNGPELTRVELDGQGVQQAGGTDMLGGITAGADGAGGRGVEMRQLSSDLIKSVDVVKGSTADMVEGSLGGSVRIQTRNGLDFKKDYLSIRAAGAMNSLNEKVNPNLNLVGVKKLMDGRLGVLVNLSSSKVKQEAHAINQGGANGYVGQYRPMEFDNSPEKTFSFQPSTVKDDVLSRTPNFTYPLIAGGNWVSGTPEEIVNKSAAAQTKQDCYAAFPLLTTAQANLINAANSGRTNAINARQQELLTCLGQWNDWVPSNTRYNVNRWNDTRHSGDIRLDYKVNNDLTVYAKFSRSKGTVTSYTSNMGYGGVAVNPASVTGANNFVGAPFVDTISATQLANGAWGTRAVAPGSGYYLYPGLSYRSTGAVNGMVSNVNPATVVVDKNHHVTSYQFSDGYYGVDSTLLDIGTKSSYTQAGGTYKKGIVRAEFLLGDAKSDFYRSERRVNMGGYVGPVTANLLPNGIWNFTNNNNADMSNPASWYRLSTQPAVTANGIGTPFVPPTPAYTANQLPLVSAATQLPFQNARINESYEKTAKLDLAITTSEYSDYITRVKVGYNRRKSGYDAWGTGGYTVQEPVGTYGAANYIPGIYVPNSNLRTTFQVCQDTPGSLGAGGRPCKYGYTPNYDPRSNLAGTVVLTPDQYADIFKQAYTQQPTAEFYAGDPKRPGSLTEGWTEFDIAKLYSLLGVPNYNLNCIKTCQGSDGKTYKQPLNAVVETVDGGYLMADFKLDQLPFTNKALPFGIEFDGNFGYRMVKTKVRGTGQLTFVSIKKNANFNPLDPLNANGVDTRTYRQDTTINASVTDYLPALNLNTWLVADKLVLRYNHAKTIARPPAGRLIPSGTCTYDERFLDQVDADGSQRDQLCSGVMGNPELKPQTNKNQNLSLEWYVNKDTMLAGAIYKQKGIIGAPTLTETINGARIFEGSGVTDPQTGQNLSDLQFNYRRYTNQLPNVRKGFELSSKTAFTFLPWYFRNLGLDANYTRNKSDLVGTVVRDLITGQVMPVAGEPKYSWNSSLWYDDGAFSARVALQVVAEKFICISGCNSQHANYPTDGSTRVVAPAYAPGAPIFQLGTRYVDAKLAYKFKNGLEIFIEGRNLGKTHTGTTSGPIANFADGTKNVYTDNYAGATYMAGINFKFE